MLLYYLSSMLFLFFSILLFIFSINFNINKISYFFEWNIFNFNSFNINMFLLIDWMSLLFMFTVMFISSMILFYSIEYMNHDLFINRFFYLMLMFILSMLISILIGWDGLGLVSYCLVIYYQNFYSFKAGMLTVLSNRLGDIAIIMSLSIMMFMGSWNFFFYYMNKNLMLFLIIFAAFTKSAQFPFSAWLPAAMAAPTPVSSLVHSSTLETAGIYLLIRFNYMKMNNILMKMFLIIGLITMFMASLSANLEFDMKKVIAFLTLSQLGLMMMIYSMKKFDLAFFHLITHAMFKSMMFMCSGIMIHNMLNYQDIRFMNKIKDNMPLTSMMLIISTLSLCGMPFMSGFYSKDMILENFFMMKFSMIIYLFTLISTMLTLMYSLRLIYYLFNKNFMLNCMFNIKDNKKMNYSMLSLMLMSMMFGWYLNWMIYLNIELIFLSMIEKLLIMMLFLLFIILNKMNYMYNFKNFINYKKFLMSLWMLNYMIDLMKIKPMIFSKKWFKLFDKSWSEYMFKNLMLNFMNMNKYYMNNKNNMFMMFYFMMFMILLLL
nr:NADH dehydrogenase subunit 5 [Platyneura mayri]